MQNTKYSANEKHQRVHQDPGRINYNCLKAMSIQDCQCHRPGQCNTQKRSDDCLSNTESVSLWYWLQSMSNALISGTISLSRARSSTRAHTHARIHATSTHRSGVYRNKLPLKNTAGYTLQSCVTQESPLHPPSNWCDGGAGRCWLAVC